MAQTIHFIRHGEVFNPEKILYGRQPGWRLSERGQEMAQVIGDWSAALSLGAIHTSPLQRAKETVAPIVAKHNLPLVVDENLIEVRSLN
jgi:broad specificity phosphatase PhoE